MAFKGLRRRVGVGGVDITLFGMHLKDVLLEGGVV